MLLTECTPPFLLNYCFASEGVICIMHDTHVFCQKDIVFYVIVWLRFINVAEEMFG